MNRNRPLIGHSNVSSVSRRPDSAADRNQPTAQPPATQRRMVAAVRNDEQCGASDAGWGAGWVEWPGSSCAGSRNARCSLHCSIGTCVLCAWRRLWGADNLRAQTAMALGHRSTRMDVCDLLSHSRQDDLGAQTCSSLCLSDCLRCSRDEPHLSRAITDRFRLRASPTNLLSQPFPPLHS